MWSVLGKALTLKPNKPYFLHTHTDTHAHTLTVTRRHTPFKAFHLEIAFDRQGD